MDATNMAVLAELKEYAQLYFSAIVEMYTAEGKCNLKPGKYSAKELADNNKAACGLYALPEDPMFDGLVTITAGTFECEFPYRNIFSILAKWEEMSKAGKLKAIFEIGEVEEKSVKVLLNEKTELGAFKTKRMKLQRVTGNWWMPRKYKENDTVFLYYELNGVMFKPGKFVIGSNLQHPSTKEWCKRYNDEEISKLLLSFLSIHRAGKQQDTPYFVEVANRANIGLQATETPRIPTETTEAVNVLSEEATPEQARVLETSRIEHERKLREEEARAPQSYQDEINAYKATQAHVEPAKLHEQANVSIQGNDAPVKHISEIMEICRLYDEGGEKTDEYRYYEWLAGTQCGVYRTIADNALIEAFVRIFDAAYRKGKGHIVARNSQGVLIETVITTIEPSQPRKAKCVTDMPVLRKTAGKRAKRSALRTAKPQARSKTHGAASVPRSVLWIVPQGQTVVFHSRCYITYQFADVRKMAHTPPIRGDCVKIDGCTRDKSLCCADNDEINGLKLS